MWKLEAFIKDVMINFAFIVTPQTNIIKDEAPARLFEEGKVWAVKFAWVLDKVVHTIFKFNYYQLVFFVLNSVISSKNQVCISKVGRLPELTKAIQYQKSPSHESSVKISSSLLPVNHPKLQYSKLCGKSRENLLWSLMKLWILKYPSLTALHRFKPSTGVCASVLCLRNITCTPEARPTKLYWLLILHIDAYWCILKFTDAYWNSTVFQKNSNLDVTLLRLLKPTLLKWETCTGLYFST